MIGDNLEIYTYDYLLNLALNYVPDDLDKREGAIIYDALAPSMMVVTLLFMEQRNYYLRTYADTAYGEFLDLRVKEQGLTRYPATYAIKKGYFADTSGAPMDVNIGARFSTVSDTNPINYAITSPYLLDGVHVPGTYELTCEVPGTIGNEYSGNLVNITFIQGMATATMSDLLVPARDTETDEELRERYFDTLDQKAFGGNIADYRNKLKEINGVGEVQIYPVWNGGGTVKISVIDPSYNPITPEFIQRLEQEIDPENVEGDKGTGLGIAPIGHNVTITTPDSLTVDVEATITLAQGYSIGQVEQPIKDALEGYMLNLRRQWADADSYNVYSLSVYLSRVISEIVAVPGVANATGVTINGDTADIVLEQNGQTQQIPILGTVTLNGQ